MPVEQKNPEIPSSQLPARARSLTLNRPPVRFTLFFPITNGMDLFSRLHPHFLLPLTSSLLHESFLPALRALFLSFRVY